MVSHVDDPAGYEMQQVNNDNQNVINNNISQESPIYHPILQNSQPPNRDRSSIFGRFIFQNLLMLSVVRLIIYLNKLYQDVNAVSEYSSARDIYFCLISIAALAVPPFIYAIYLIGSNLAIDEEVDKTDISTKTINGFLLIPWQIKRLLDVLHFAAQRVCFWRSPDEKEKEDIETMKHSAEVLEFFEDFYSGFLQILLQLYILMLTLEQKEAHETKFLVGELIGSGLCVMSMMAAVKRRDDGPLTCLLSWIGWASIFVSRIIVFSLIASFITIWLLILCLIHALAVSIWVYSIAIESHHLHSSTTQTHTWTLRKRISMAILVFLFFGVPSLVLWPIMFQLKERRRPLIFLLIITIENILLLALWFIFQASLKESLQQLTDTHVLIVTGVVCTTLSGVLFLTGYILCKPKLTDQVVLHEMRATNAATYGIYYEFCDIVFKLPNTQRIERDLEIVRRFNENL